MHRIRRWGPSLLLLSPTLILLGIFVYGFLGWNLRVSLSNWRGLRPDYAYDGFDNYTRLADDTGLRGEGEPLSNLDAKLRVSMRAQLSLLHQRLGVTTVYVTHDQVEAMTLGQRVTVLRDGVVQQCDTPQALYHRPVNLFVAAFIGSPAMNLVHAKPARGAVSFDDITVPLPAGSSLAREEREVILGIRPTGLAPASPDGPDGRPAFKVVPALVEDLGDERYSVFDVDAPRVDTESTRAAVAASAGDALLVPEDRAHFTVRLPSDLPVTVGDPVAITVNPDRMYLFDPRTGEAVG